MILSQRVLIAFLCCVFSQPSCLADHDQTFFKEMGVLSQDANNLEREYRTDDAINIYKQIIQKSHDAGDFFWAENATSSLARLYEKNKRYDDAINVLKDGIAYSRKDERKSGAFFAQSQLENVYLASGRIDDFARMQDEALNKVKSDYGPDSMAVAQKCEDLASRLNRAYPKPFPEKAAFYQKQAEDVISRIKQRKNIEAQVRQLRSSALHLVASGNVSAAEPGLAKAVVLAHGCGKWSPELPPVLIENGYLKEALKKNEEALNSYKEAIDLLRHTQYQHMQYAFTRNGSQCSTTGFSPANMQEAMALFLRLLQNSGRRAEAEAFWKEAIQPRVSDPREIDHNILPVDIDVLDKDGKRIPGMAAILRARSRMTSVAEENSFFAFQFPKLRRNLKQLALDDIKAIENYPKEDSDKRNNVPVVADSHGK